MCLSDLCHEMYQFGKDFTCENMENQKPNRSDMQVQ